MGIGGWGGTALGVIIASSSFVRSIRRREIKIDRPASCFMRPQVQHRRLSLCYGILSLIAHMMMH